LSGIKDRKVQITEVIASSKGLVTKQDVLREATDDESQSTEVTVNSFVAHWCGHYKPYGFSCFCGGRFCRECLDKGRISYCEECGRTIGPCCCRKRYDAKVLCPEHWKIFDFNHPGFHILGGICFLVGLVLAIYLINQFLR
jgi:hypothetical protein